MKAINTIDKTKVPSDSEIDAEIAKLESLRRNVPDTPEGASIHDQIKAQVQVLTELIGVGRLEDQFQDGDADVLDAALNAREWMDGDGGPANSEHWKSILAKAEAHAA